ncbi:MAG: DUF3413 domain-containing protein [Deltaproteobacteria bacterium]|nr:DUF3413 domain-containing protein [Deltaproteobacteria bacterium]
MAKNDVVSDKVPRIIMFRWALWFMFANAAALMLISLNYLKSMPLPDKPLPQLFLALSYPGHFFSMSLYAAPLIAAAILIYPRRRFVFGLSIVLELSLVLVIIIDSLVFAQYRFHLNGMIWNLLTSGAASDVLPVTGLLWLILCIAIIFIALCEWLLAVASWRWVQKKRRRYGIVVGSLFALIILFGHGMHAWADANNFTLITSQVRYLPAYKPLTMKRFMERMGFSVKNETGKLHLNANNSALRYPLETITCDNNSKKLNLLLIVIDSWRFDALTPEITPHIWELSKNNLRFDNHFSSGNCTRFGIFGLFYGLYGTYWHALLAEQRSPVLMREMQKQSYRMGIFASAPLVSPEFDRTVFADIRSRISLRQDGERPYQRDRTITDKMLNFIADTPTDSPFFGFLFYDAPHAAEHPADRTPFQPALKEVNYLALNNRYDPLPYLNKYKNSVHYVDTMVQEVLTVLSKKNLLDSTIVVITGDHGQEFNDLKMNYWGHTGNFSRFQTQTPMVIHWPGKAPRIFTHTTSHLDLPPTLMQQMLGCTNDPAIYSNGRSLLDISPRPYVLASSWDTFGVIEPDRTTVSLQAGELDILDKSYRPIEGAKIRPEITKSAMEGVGRFFAR